MGSCRGNAWIGMLLRYYDNRHFLKTDGSFDLTTNVEVITHLTSQKYGLIFDGEKKTFGNNMILLPFDYLCAKDMNTGEEKVTDNTFTIHHFTGSWLPQETKEYIKIFHYYHQRYRGIGFPEFLAFQLTRISTAYAQGGILYILKKLYNKIYK